MLGRILSWTLTRRLAWRAPVRVVAIGGATLGGSGKTPLAMACVSELAAAGARAVLVGHAYRANPGRPRIVAIDDPLTEVGDEALVAVRALAPCGARVVVAPTRAAAIALAARDADVLVLDGVAQTSPVRASIALLSVDSAEPWGREAALPPRGVLRAPVAALLDACDVVVPAAEDDATVRPIEGARDVWGARVETRGAWLPSGALLDWDAIRPARVGLIVALARADRVLRSLAQHGVRPRVVVRGRDHGPIGARARALAAREPVDLWLASPKCALHAPPSLRAPLATLDHRVILHSELRSRLRALARLTHDPRGNSLNLYK